MTTPERIWDAKKIHKKLKLAGELFQFAMEVKKTQLKRKHPELSERELTLMAYDLIEQGCK
jgi:hypothetical protein